MIAVSVTEVPEDPHGASVVVFSGLVVGSDRPVCFAVDHRVASDLVERVEWLGEVECLVERWQILSA